MRPSVFSTRWERTAAWWQQRHGIVAVLATACGILLAAGSGFAWRAARAEHRQAVLARGEYIRLALEAQRQIDSLAAGGFVKLGPNDVVIRRGTIQ